MRKLLFILSLLCATFASAANVGDWTYYFAYHNATFCQPVGKMLYALYDGNLLVYNTETGEVGEITKLTGLSNKNITKMAYCKAENKMILTYDNGVIDLLDVQTGECFTIPQFANKYDGIVFNDITIVENEALIGTSKGLLHIDVSKQLIAGLYFENTPIRSGAIFNGSMYAATDAGMMKIALTKNLLDASQWVKWNTLKIKYLKTFADHLYLGLDSGGWRMFNTTQNGMLTLTAPVLKNVFVGDNQMVLYTAGKNEVYFLTPESPEVLSAPATMPSSPTAIAVAASGDYWACLPDGRLAGCKLVEDEITETGTYIGGYGPKRDICYYLNYVGERLLVGGGKLDPYDKTHFPGTVMYYENDAWTIFQEEGIAEATGGKYQDITCVVQHPSDPTMHIASAARVGLFVFKDGQFQTYYSNDNSPLLSASSSKNYVRIDGLNYDSEGNLWMVNNQVDSSIVVLKNDGTWQKFGFEPIQKAPTLEKTLFDRKGRLWVCSRRTVEFHTSGLLAFDYNGTLSNTNDDIYKFRSEVTNQDGTSYEFNGIYSIAEDHNGAIWVGSSVGLFVIEDPDEWFNDDYLITQIKVPRNDGTNLADYLLSGTPISAIAVDGGNRKWIGTESNGLYLVSADGIETIHHFTKENSPLPSNTINSLAIHPATGEVMIGTDKGLVSYMSDATAPAASLSESNIEIYPNPLRPEMNSNVTIKGLTSDADIKIATAGGQVVAGGTSVGGMWQWNGRTFANKIAGSGIYYVLISTSDGGTAVAGKILVVR